MGENPSQKQQRAMGKRVYQVWKGSNVSLAPVAAPVLSFWFLFGTGRLVFFDSSLGAGAPLAGAGTAVGMAPWVAPSGELCGPGFAWWNVT